MPTRTEAETAIIDLRDSITITRRPGRLRDARVAVLGVIDDMTYNVVASLGAAGVHVEVLAPHGSRRLQRSRFCRALHCIGPAVRDAVPAGASDVVRDVIVGSDIHVVVGADYHSQLWLADHTSMVAPAVAFPTPTRAQIERCNDKWQLMQLCAALGVDHPASALVEDTDDLERLPHGGRVVVKPLSEGFGFGVYELASVGDLREHLVRDDRPGNALPQLVQEHVPGVDVDVTMLVDHGRTVAGVVQERLPDGRSLRFSIDRRFLEPVERLAEAVAFHGVMDFDLRHDPVSDRVTVIECNPRFPGSLLNKTWAGANFALDGVALALGFPIVPVGAGWPAVYHPPTAAHVALLAQRRFWRDELAPTRDGWRFRTRDLGYVVSALLARRAATRGR